MEEEMEGGRHPPHARSPPTFQPRLSLCCARVVHGLGWVGSRFVSFWWVALGWIHYNKSTKNLKGLF